MQNFLLDAQEKFKYSNWFSLEPGEGAEGGRVAKAEFTRGQSIQRLDPVTGEEGHLEDTGRIWVSWYSWAPQARRRRPTLPPAALGSARQDGHVKSAWGPRSSGRSAASPKPSVWVALGRPRLARQTGPMWQRHCQESQATVLCSPHTGEGWRDPPRGFSEAAFSLPYW